MNGDGFQVAGFDLDDTLYPEREYVLSGFRAVGEFAASNLDIPNFYELLQKVSEEGDAAGRVFDVALERVGVSYDVALVQAMVSLYHDDRRDLILSAFPDVMPTLEQLRQSYKLVLITDGPPNVQWNKIRALRLEETFDRIYCTGEYGREFWKPSPFAFRQTMADLGVSGPSCAYVGNDPRKDFLAPNQLGWLTIQIQRNSDVRFQGAPDPGYEAHVCISELRGLDALLSNGKPQ